MFPLHNFKQTGCICASYFLLVGLRYFYYAKWGKKGWRHTPISQTSYGMVWRRNTIVLIPSPHQFPHWLLLHNWKRALRLRVDQTVIPLVPRWRGSGYHPSLKLLQDTNQSRAQLEYELIQESQGLAERYKCKCTKQAQRHTRWQAQLLDQTNTTFQEVFLQASLMVRHQITALVCHCSHAFLLHKWNSGYCHSTGWECPLYGRATSHWVQAWALWLAGSRSL